MINLAHVGLDMVGLVDGLHDVALEDQRRTEVIYEMKDATQKKHAFSFRLLLGGQAQRAAP